MKSLASKIHQCHSKNAKNSIEKKLKILNLHTATGNLNAKLLIRKNNGLDIIPDLRKNVKKCQNNAKHNIERVIN